MARVGILTLQLRLPDCPDLSTKRRRLGEFKAIWGSKHAYGVKEMFEINTPNQAGFVITLIGENENAVRLLENDLLSWLDNFVEAYIEKQLLEIF